MKSLPVPIYAGPTTEDLRPRFALGVESMRRHMTNEGWELMLALQGAGYVLTGYNCPYPETDVAAILAIQNPSVVVIQDKREWEGLTAERKKDPKARFTNVESLKSRSDIFKVTVVKDAQNGLAYHAESAEEIGCHAWIVYYQPDRVCQLAPYLRRQHVIRTYHTIDSEVVPTYSSERDGCIISGALGSAYPLRTRLVKDLFKLPKTFHLPHPGYHERGSNTPGFIQKLSTWKVAICTSSRYGYALRKIMEATAAGCVVITDLPHDDKLPGIDGNLARISPNAKTEEVARVMSNALVHYNPEIQEHWAKEALRFYDYRVEGVRLALEIEKARRGYNG